MKKLAAIIVAVAVVASGAMAFAGADHTRPTRPPRPPHPPRPNPIEIIFKLLDQDANGTLSAEEVAKIPILSDHFNDLDSDDDGALTLDEFKQLFHRPPQPPPPPPPPPGGGTGGDPAGNIPHR
jgi:hypothetical protein